MRLPSFSIGTKMVFFASLILAPLSLFAFSWTRKYREELEKKQEIIEKTNKELESRLKELSRLNDFLRKVTIRDELTQIYNRRHFYEVLPLEIKRAERFGKPLSLLMLDIDYFKRFNDRYGHLAGDERLKDFARLVSSKIREVDFFARFGGEEFVLILPNTPKKDALLVAEKIRTLIHDYPFSNSDIPLRVSIGVASYSDDAQSMEDFIDAADIALYQAKGSGRDQVSVSNGERYRSLPMPLI